MDRRDQINFRLDPELSQILQAQCQELGITKTEFAKRALRSALGQPLEPLPGSKPLMGAIEGIEERLAKLEHRMFTVEEYIQKQK